MRLNLKAIAAVACATVITVQAEGPSVSFTGALDADASADFHGNYFNSTELDLGMTVNLSDKVSSHVYATANSINADANGSVPAGYGDPGKRWLTFNFDGYDITYASKLGTFTVGDLVYQYGKFNYYFYKHYSMITGENCTRGIKYGIGNDKLSTEIQIGSADAANTADVVGATKIGLNDKNTINVFYGIRGNSLAKFKSGTDAFLGLEYNGSVGDAAKIKFDVGYRSLASASADSDRANVVTLLLEPSLTLGKFSLAMTGFYMIDPDSANTPGVKHIIKRADYGNGNFDSKFSDEWFIYAEPGITFNDYLGLGLPIEYHGQNATTSDDDQFWLVPTFYIYPTKNVQWWIWGQMVDYTGDSSKDLGWAAGSEVIVNF